MNLMRRSQSPLGWLDDFFRADWVTSFEETSWPFTVDVEETDKSYVVKADLPGMEEKDIKVEMVGTTLTISGQRTGEQREKKANYHRVERFSGCFCRSVELPREVDSARTTARYKNGVLTVELPKTGGGKSKKIDVKLS